MFEFFKTKKFKVIIAMLAVLFGIMLYSASVDGVGNIPENLLTMITTPFSKLTATVSHNVGSFFDKYLNITNTLEQNEALKDEVDKLRKQLIDFERIKDENEQLKEITGIKNIYPDFTTTSAFVISRDPADIYGSFIVDRGSLHGISKNDPVITDSGLVGIVTQVNPTSSRVKTIFSPDIDVSAYEIVSKELGIVSGDIGLSSQGVCKMSLLSSTTAVKRDDIIVTAGASGMFPKGIPIGKVLDISNEANGVTVFATVSPMNNIKDLSSVFIVTEFLGQGSELLE